MAVSRKRLIVQIPLKRSFRFFRFPALLITDSESEICLVKRWSQAHNPLVVRNRLCELLCRERRFSSVESRAHLTVSCKTCALLIGDSTESFGLLFDLRPVIGLAIEPKQELARILPVWRFLNRLKRVRLCLSDIAKLLKRGGSILL